jgi:hypothetical protein
MANAMEKIEKILHASVPFQNRFVQFKNVAGMTDEFDALMAIPHVRAVWEKLCEANDTFVEISNAEYDVVYVREY